MGVNLKQYERVMEHIHHHPHQCCGGMSRRELFTASAAVTLAAGPARAWAEFSSGGRPSPIRVPLKVQPVFVYQLPRRKPQTSWRPWGGIMTEQDVAAEKTRINKELAELKAAAEFPIEILPLAVARNTEEAEAITGGSHDTCLMYAASGGLRIYETLNAGREWNIMFVRHRSGPAYLWYEIAHPRFLRKTVDEYGEPGMDSDDVVVDSYDDLLWRLRALAGLKNTLGKRVVCLGGAGGWGKGGELAPFHARETWKFDLVDVSYEDLAQRIQSANNDEKLVSKSRAEADRYMNGPGVSLETDAEAVRRAFLLNHVFESLLAEAETDTFTIQQCMSAIMPISKTTACLPLSLLNDNGFLAFCESDFVVIPSGVLLHYISGKPVFLNDPTYPHHGVVTLAHCTAPRRMDGLTDEPVRILTHFESDYGAAPKVEMKKGQTITGIVPNFGADRWLGFQGKILDSPFLPICRSQIDVEIEGDHDRLTREMQGFHWMVGYGSYRKELGYALKKRGVEWVAI